MKAEDDVDVVSVAADYDDQDDNDAESDNDDDTHDEMTMLIPADGSVCVKGYISMCQVVEQDPEAPRGSRKRQI